MIEILERLRDHLKAKNKVDDIKDVEIARTLGFIEHPSQNIQNWRKRGKMPWKELYDYAIKEKIPLDWLFSGHWPEIDDYWQGCEEAKPMCEEIREIVKSGDIDVIEALNKNIKEFKKSVEKDKTIKKLGDEIIEIKRMIGKNKKKTNSKDHKADTPEKLAESIG